MPVFPEQDADEDVWGTGLRNFFSPHFNLTTGDRLAFLMPDGTAGAPSVSFKTQTTSGFYFDTIMGPAMSQSSTPIMAFNAGIPGVVLAANGLLTWTNTNNILSATRDVILARDAANILALRNGTNTQELRIYNTDSGSDDEFSSLGWKNIANVFSIEPEKTGTGTLRGLNICAAAGSLGFYGTTPTVQLTGVAVTAAGIHAALVTLGLITA